MSSPVRSPRIAVSPRKAALGASTLLSSESLGARLDELERKIERLRSLHEAFFLGTERRPPQVSRQELNRLMLETQQLTIRNAGLKFRFQSLSQRWTLLTTYWNRVLREMESGTYRRDLQKAFRRTADRGAPLTEQEAVAMGVPAGRAKAFVTQQSRRHGGGDPPPEMRQAEPEGLSGEATSPMPRQNRPEGAPFGAVGGGATPLGRGSDAPAAASAMPPPAPFEKDQLDALHRSYVEAHARMGLPGAPPTAEKLRAKVGPLLQRLHAAHPTATFGLRVVSEGGKLIIKAKSDR